MDTALQQKVIANKIKELTEDKTPEQLAKNQEYQSPTEVGMKNALTGDGIWVRDDNCIEIRAGSSYILIDGESGQITINGETIATNVSSLHLNTNPGEVNIGGIALNPIWNSGITSLLNRSALTPTPAAIPLSIVTKPLGGGPDIPMPFLSLFTPTPLFINSLQSINTASIVQKILEEHIK